jgi:hypothetical protein
VTIAGHLHLDGLQPAIDLAGDQTLCRPRPRAPRQRSPGPAEQRGQHLAGRVHVVVDRLLAGQHRPGCSRLPRLGEDLGHGQRLDIGVHVVGGHHQDRRGPRPWPARCAAFPAPASRRWRRRRPRRPCRPPSGGSPLRRRSRRTGSSTSSRWQDRRPTRLSDPVRLHADLHVVVDHALDGHQHLQKITPPE